MIEKYNVQGVRYLIFKYHKKVNDLVYFSRVTVWKTSGKYSVFVYFMDGTENDTEKQIFIVNSVKDVFGIVKNYKAMIENI